MAGLVPSAFICIVASPHFTGRWFEAAEAACEYGQQIEARGRDAYIALGAHGKRLDTGRGKASNIVGIGGAWADVDIRHPEAHKKQNLVASVDEAEGLIASAFPKPSILIHSGHGLQAYWLFAEPWMWALDDDEERAKAAAFVSDWTDTLRAKAKACGVDVDATKDLARIFRLPGTTNFKAEPVPVTVLWPFDLSTEVVRYALAKLREFIPEPSEPLLVAPPASSRETRKIVASDNGRAVDPDLSAKIQIACEVDPKFRKTWHRQRTDMQDQSASAYDLAILNALVGSGGWSDEDGIEACRMWRRLHGEDATKLDRQKYVADTLDLVRTRREDGPPPSEAYALISQMTGVQVTAIERSSPGVPVRVRIHVLDSGGEPVVLVFPDSVTLYRSSTAFGDACLWQARVPAKRLKGKAWGDVVTLMARAADTLDVGSEGSEDGETMRWLITYRANQLTTVVHDLGSAPQNGPFVHEGRFYFTSNDVGRVLRITDVRITDRALCQRLKAIGCVRKAIHVQTLGDRRTTRSVWSLADLALIGSPLEVGSGSSERSEDGITG